LIERLSEIIDGLPRIPLLDGPTQIHRLRRLEHALGPALNGVRLYAKRDDLMSLGGGGNKLRKLEFLLADAIAQGADTIIAIGGLQSNFARLTAAAAARLDLSCELVLARMVQRDGPEYEKNGNILLDDLFGARVHDLAPGRDALHFAQERAVALRGTGRTAYVAAAGGSTPIGCVGYALCAHEIQQQASELGINFASIVVPNGSSGTHAGLVAGLRALDLDPTIVRSHAVLAPADVARRTTLDKANGTLELLGTSARLCAADINISGDQLGAGYGATTVSMIEAVRLMASREGILLDPVYSGKAFAGLLADVRAGYYKRDSDLLFIMTGGTPGLYAYASAFL
jgi:L-cysteate sulfo-lyase